MNDNYIQKLWECIGIVEDSRSRGPFDLTILIHGNLFLEFGSLIMLPTETGSLDTKNPTS